MFYSPELRADEVPDADAIVIYADAQLEQLACLPLSKGQRFIYLQGYGTPDNPVVIRNLRQGFPVVASARWLVTEATRHGSPAIFVPYGLDKSIFNVRSSFCRNNVVSMMASAVPWKGLVDGLEALRQVRAVLNDVEVVLFGTDDPGFENATFVSRPSREQVGDIMRQSAVYVYPSWEEGFGMPGLEAMACGAALATTDTKGSRDYAIDGRTALVSAPKDPIALARNIVVLLSDLHLRNCIAAAGHRRAMDYPEWSAASLRFLRALVCWVPGGNAFYVAHSLERHHTKHLEAWHGQNALCVEPMLVSSGRLWRCKWTAFANQIANEPRGTARYRASQARIVGAEMANWSTRLATG